MFQHFINKKDYSLRNSICNNTEELKGYYWEINKEDNTYNKYKICNKEFVKAKKNSVLFEEIKKMHTQIKYYYTNSVGVDLETEIEKIVIDAKNNGISELIIKEILTNPERFNINSIIPVDTIYLDEYIIIDFNSDEYKNFSFKNVTKNFLLYISSLDYKYNNLLDEKLKIEYQKYMYGTYNIFFSKQEITNIINIIPIQFMVFIENKMENMLKYIMYIFDKKENVKSDKKENIFDSKNIPQINLKVLSGFVTSQNKKLKTVWRPEFNQEYDAFKSVENELSNSIAKQVDWEIMIQTILNKLN
jgi:hypothetical protein